MRVGAWQVQRTAATIRGSLRMQWEDRDHPDAVAWMEWPAEHGTALVTDANSALLAAWPLALWHGERRVQLEGAVCPRLADNTRTGMAILASWNPAFRPPTLEAEEGPGDAAVPVAAARHAALCLSGGVDALAALSRNRRQLPVGHPARYRVGLHAFGLNSYDLANDAPRPERLRFFQVQAERVDRLAASCDVTLVRVASNLRSLYPSFEAWGASAHTSALAAFGHVLRGRVRSLAIASAGAGVGPGIVPHPLLDGCYASHDLDVHSVHATVPRLAKVREIARWPEALAILRVCFLVDLPKDGALNCGHCEKCVRTMVELIAAGGDALARAPFPAADVTPADVERLPMDGLATRIFFSDVLPALTECGRSDLVRAIQRRLAQAPQAPRAPAGEPSPRWRGWWRGR